MRAVWIALTTPLLSVLFAQNAGATEIILPADRIVRIRATVGDDSHFVGGITLQSAEAVQDLSFRASDLVSGTGDRIRGSQITLVGSPQVSLAASTPLDLDVKVGGVTQSGVYTGTLYFLAPREAGQAVSAAIEVTALAVPRLTQRKGSEAIKIQLINCSGLGCTIARRIEPGAFLASYPVAFDNATGEEVKLSASLSATGEITHGSVDSVLRVETPITVSPASIFSFPIQIASGGSPRPLPDHYVGDLQLRGSSATPIVRIPLEVNVRAGPMWPLATLFGGILLGQILRYMGDRGKAQSDLLLAYYDIQGEARHWPADYQLLLPAFDAARNAVYGLRLDEARTALAAIATRWRTLTRLRSLEDMVQAQTTDPAVKIRADIQSTRRLVELGRDGEAAAALTRIEDAAAALGSAPPAVVAMDMGFGRAETKPSAPGTFWERVRAVRAQLTLWLARPMLYLVLLGSLTIVGLLQLYVKNATFGASPVSDYFGLLVWAMSADVASRSLANLKS